MTIRPETTRFDLAMQTREAPVSTVDRDARTIDLVWTTGATVRRRRYRGWDESVPYDETLVVSEAAIDLSRLRAGGPVLDSHSTWTTRAQVGVVDRVWIEGGQGLARVRFPSAGVDEAADRMFGLVAEGIVRNVSVGYSVDKVDVTEPQKRDDVEQWRVVRWTPFEISFVTVPADAGAQTRAAEPQDRRLFPAIVTRSGSDPQETIIMTTETRSEPGAASETQQQAAAPDTAVAEAATRAAAETAVRAERARSTEITQIGQRHGLDAEMVRRAIDDGVAVTAFREAVLDHLAETSAARGVRVAVINPGESPAQRLDAMADGMLLRALGRIKPTRNAFGETETDEQVRGRTARGREFASMGLLDFGAEILGIRGRMSRTALFDEIVKRAGQHGTTDFPNLLAAAANKFLLQQYQYQEASYRKFARKRNFNDFKVHNFLRLGDFPLLQPLSETGEFKYGTLSESKQTLIAGTYGVIVAITRQMFVNDDLGTFADLTGMAGRRAMDFENRTAWAIVLQNSGAGPTLADGYNLFDATNHANAAATAAGINIASMDLGYQSLQSQKSLDGVPLNSVPKMILCGPKKRMEAKQLLSTNLLATQISNINVFEKEMDLVVDAYITDKSWYLFGDPASVPVFQWGYVDGYEGPRFALDQPFKQDGLALKVAEDFGFGAIDWRGGYFNAGA